MVTLAFLLPLVLSEEWNAQLALAAVFAIIGLSINLLTGRSGQVSLGHQGLVGIGAFTSALVAVRLDAGFFAGLVMGGLAAGGAAALLGLVALRAKGLALAVLTLGFGRMVETGLFTFVPFAGPVGGAPAPRPAAFASGQAYAYLCLLVLLLVILVDWRLSRTRAGRAMKALRTNPRVAAALGIDVFGYRELALIASGMLAGVAGALFAHLNGIVRPGDFTVFMALLWLVMAVVGGLRSRAGVVAASVVFSLFPYLLARAIGHQAVSIGGVGPVPVASFTLLLAGVAVLLSLTLYRGGVGRALLPVRGWISGTRLGSDRRSQVEQEDGLTQRSAGRRPRSRKISPS